MPAPVFEQAFLLQSLGWSIANSFWQTGLLWLSYQVITGMDRKMPAVLKHHLSLLFLALSFTWFIATLVQNYSLLSTGRSGESTLSTGIITGGFIAEALPFLSTIYLLLLGVFTVRFARQVSGNFLLQRTGLTRAPVDIRLFASKTGLHLGIKRKVKVWISAHVDVPCVTGFLKPVILLPAAMITNLTLRQTEAVLLHELAHIRRMDYLVNFIQSLIELLLFFNPFALMLGTIARKERENCCDDWVINFEFDRFEYATALVLLEEQRFQLQPSEFALTATNGNKPLMLRVKRLFGASPKVYISNAGKLKLVGLGLVFVAAMAIFLPPVIRQGSAAQPAATVITPKPVFIQPVSLESPSRSMVVNNPPDLALVPRQTVKNPPITSKRKPAVRTREYINAYINEELLAPAVSSEPLITMVGEKEPVASRVFVRVEEEQSGKKQTNTYYFELNDKDGSTAIKPLILLNRIKARVRLTKPILKTLPATVDTLSHRKYVRRITS
jgi:beta-lactamase regulating signal transducer with metallopeptidase domain